MNKNQLKRILKGDDAIREDMYSLDGGLPNERLCINKNEEYWEVYYSERGRKSGLKIFYNEELACQFFYETILRMKKPL